MKRGLSNAEVKLRAARNGLVLALKVIDQQQTGRLVKVEDVVAVNEALEISTPDPDTDQDVPHA